MRLLIILFLVVGCASCTKDEMENRFLFIGDSHVERWDLNYYFPSEEVFNDGTGGAIVKDAIVKVAAVNPKQFQKCFIEIGTNDIRKYLNNDSTENQIIRNVLADYTSMLLSASSRFDKVYVLSVIPLSKLNTTGSALIYEAVNTRISDLVQKYPNCTFINVNEVLADDKKYLDPALTLDGLHLNSIGYERISNKIRSYVR